MTRRSGSLRTRLVILCVTLVACAIAATATIVSLSTTASIQQRYRQDIASDAKIYNALLAFAATHPSWSALTPAQLRTIDSGAGHDSTIGVDESLFSPTRGEERAAQQLTGLFKSCLRAAGQQLPPGYPQIKQVGFLSALAQLKLSGPAETCLGTARRTQLSGYVAPPAVLFISGSVATQPRPSLSRAAIERIVLAATAILLVAVVAVLLAANGISRPLRTLTGAVERLRGGEPRLRVPAETGTREVAALTDAFNRMSAELELADARRKEMISDVAHELRTPLGNVRGWLEAVQDGLAEPDPQLVASLLDESRLLQSIIDDLQVLALADADRLVVHPEPIDVGDVLDQVVAAQRLNATAKGLRLSAVRTGDLRCTADPVRLRQAVGNLVSNAIRYTDRGAVTLTADGAHDEIVISVADTGPGIGADDLPYIFDRFWRAEKSRDRRSGGSGLGLAITEHLVHAHGGRIEVRSELGKGTTFSVHLPRHVAPDPQPDPQPDLPPDL